MYDVFISYRRDGGFAMARLIYENLTRRGIKTFFDMEELKSGQFNYKLYSAIEESTNFILVLPPHGLDRCCNEGDWLRIEIEHAILKNKNIVPVTMESFDWNVNLPLSLENLHLFNAVNISEDYFSASLEKLLSMLKDVNYNQEATVRREEERIANPYYSDNDKKERHRLKIQQNLVKRFDQPTYDKVINKFDELIVLDIGSNNGDFIMDRLGNNEKLSKLVGLEYDTLSVSIANERYSKINRISFYQCNVESEELNELLFSIVDENQIDKFNIINISMVLLHLKNPYKLLKTLRNYLCDDGVIIIKDIDDGLNLAYPDEEGSFGRVVEICNKNETAGYRHSGREIFTLLKRSGFKKVELEKMGLSTVNMDYEERSALFETYFSFVLEDLKLMHDKYPNDKRISLDFDWYKSKYDSLEQEFQDDNFFFNLGFVLFTAQKK
ncbi:MAG: TIR domain-containing protein [Bacilli bacterium]